MEVLTPYPHHQHVTSLNTDVAPHNLYGVESTKACGNEASIKNQSIFSHTDVTNNGADFIPDQIDGSEGEMKGSLDKEEKDSDAGETNTTGHVGKSSKKDSEYEDSTSFHSYVT